jgi:hypothetical protein
MSAADTYSSDFELDARAAAPSRNWFQRMLDRLIEARMRQAAEFIRQNRHLIPQELEEQSNWKISERSEDSLPFIR